MSLFGISIHSGVVDGTGSSDGSNLLNAGKRNNGTYQPKGTIFLASHSIVNAPRVPFWYPLHCGGNGWNWMLHVCLSGISSIVAVMDGTGCFMSAFLASPPLWQ